MSERRGNIGDIWRFDAPHWEPNRPSTHYLIVGYGPYHPWGSPYHVIELETGDRYDDLLLDDANVKNYNARKVA